MIGAMEKTEKQTVYATMPHILVVDDDERLRDLLKRYLTEHGFLVSTAEDAKSARDKLKSLSYDLLIVDIMMPGENGLSLTRALREESHQPILLLTALGETDSRITGLEAGADDYLTKPFEPRELLLRINAILRRTTKPEEGDSMARFGVWHFDPERDELNNGSERLSLTNVEATLLKALTETPGEPVSREDLARRCGLEGNERTIDVQVTRLRKKIEPDPKKPRYLQTVRGKGYILRPE